MMKLLFPSFILFLSYQQIDASHKHKLVAYWGQNAVYNQHKQREYWEKDLVEFCKDYNYDIIVLSFLNVFFDRKNRDHMPGFNFAFHCETPISSDYKTLFRCPKIEAGIKECQRRGKKVLMSLGGAVGRVGFADVDQAKLFAYRVYHLLLEGTDLKELRPFGSAVMNGIDLDIENGRYSYYTEFVQELRRLEGKQKILIGAAPQCPYPDRLLGPSPGRVLGDVPQLVDEIYIQFYNNWCHTGNTRVFDDHMQKWLSYSKKNNGPKIFIGVPSNKRASGNALHYRTPSELAVIYNKYKDEPRLGGIMFWDASFDQSNMIGGKHFSDHVFSMLYNGGGAVTKTTGKPITLKPYTGKSTTKAATTKAKTNKPQVTTQSPPRTDPTSVSCKGLGDGIYPHPQDCAKFFLCAGRRSFVKTCALGLKFDKVKLICNWAINVKC